MTDAADPQGTDGPAPDTATLARLVARLEAIAQALQAGDLEAQDAARLVGECAQTASDASAELERLTRAAAAEPLPGQDQLL